MSGRLSFLPGEISLAGISVVTTNSEKSAEVIVAGIPVKDRTIFIQTIDWRLEFTIRAENNRTGWQSAEGIGGTERGSRCVQ